VVLRPARLGRRTKAGKFDDTVLVGAANPARRCVERLLASLFDRCHMDCPIFDDLGLQKFESLMRVGSSGLSIPRFWVTPHMMRHGAPSTDVHEGTITIPEVAIRGGWGSESSCRIYNHPGALLKLVKLMNPDVRALADQLLKNNGEKLVADFRVALRSHKQAPGVQRPDILLEFSEDEPLLAEPSDRLHL